MTIDIERETDFELPDDYEDIIRCIVMAAADFVKCPYECQVDVTLVDNQRIHELNFKFRNVDSPTDVLSFPMTDYESAGDFSLCELHPERYFDAASGELMLGDIVISVEKLIQQALSYGHSARRELAFLTAHSMLHLFGYDHIEEDQRIQMEAMQETILNKEGFTRQ